jgi:hypothetical protein
MFTGLAKVDDRFHALRFELRQSLKLWLAAGAILIAHTGEVENRGLFALNLSADDESRHYQYY